MIVILIEVVEGRLQRFRGSPVAAHHARQDGEQQRPPRVPQLGERDATEAATELADRRAAHQAQKVLAFDTAQGVAGRNGHRRNLHLAGPPAKKRVDCLRSCLRMRPYMPPIRCMPYAN